MHPEVLFPPLITPVRLREADDAYRAAMREGAAQGAGTLFHVGRFDTIEFALVLEPEEPLKVSRKIAFAGMNALGAALAHAAPPEMPLGFVYPLGVRVDGADLGRARLGVPAGTGEDDVPEFLVFAVDLRAQALAGAPREVIAHSAFLAEEGFDSLHGEELAASFCRHFMAEAEEWRERGFREIGARYLARLERNNSGRHGLSATGDLVLDVAGTEVVLARLAEALAAEGEPAR